MVSKSFVRACAQCGADIIAPEWSEYLSPGRVRNFWTCEDCGYNFEDSVYFSAPLEGARLASDA
jgi:ribosomal protein L37AE/L43A